VSASSAAPAAGFMRCCRDWAIQFAVFSDKIRLKCVVFSVKRGDSLASCTVLKASGGAALARGVKPARVKSTRNQLRFGTRGNHVEN
jgi:hypothetical protein